MATLEQPRGRGPRPGGGGNAGLPRQLKRGAGVVVLAIVLIVLQQMGILPVGSTGGGASGASGTGAASGSSAGTPTRTERSPTPRAPTSRDSTPTSNATLDDGGIAELFAQRASDTWVEVTARVERTLPNDSTGDIHQRFIISFGTDLSVLVAHNVSVAPQVPLREGDIVRIRGEYEWSEKGGVLHFTHKPKFQRRDPGGWIEFGGKRYE